MLPALSMAPKRKELYSRSSLQCKLSCIVTDLMVYEIVVVVLFNSVKSLSRVWLIVTPWTAACQASLAITQSHVHSIGDANQPSHPLLFPSLPAFNLSQHQGFFPMSQFFTSGDQSIGVSASTSLLPMNIQEWSPLGWTGWISLQTKGLSRVFSNTTVQRHQFFST